jgi:transposase
MKLHDNSRLGEQLKARLLRELDRLAVLKQQISEIKKQQAKMLCAQAKPEDPSWLGMVRRLTELRGVGMTSAWVLVLEGFAWREFKNRRQVGGYIGLTPTPYQSGDSNHDQGISKAGNVWMRKLAVQLGWGWLRWQPMSETAGRFKKFAHAKRQRRVGIVVVARHLMIDLWRYACLGQLPKGATLSQDKLLEQAA